jgi:excisionase family DNA binding protein
MQQQKLLKPEEAAEILGVSVKTLTNWRHSKLYPLSFVKVGRLVRYRMEDVEGFLQKRTHDCQGT